MTTEERRAENEAKDVESRRLVAEASATELSSRADMWTSIAGLAIAGLQLLREEIESRRKTGGHEI